jgi:hypothetical protein
LWRWDADDNRSAIGDMGAFELQPQQEVITAALNEIALPETAGRLVFSIKQNFYPIISFGRYCNASALNLLNPNPLIMKI